MQGGITVEPGAQSDIKLDRRIIKTRKAILEAFDRMISNGDMLKITVSAIAREANIDRKTFYSHFSSIADLANKKTEQAIERVLKALKAKGKDKTPAEQLHIILEEVNTILLENTVAYANIATHFSTEQMRTYFDQAVDSAFEHVGIERNTETNDTFWLRLKFYRAGSWALYAEWLKSDRTQPIEEISHVIEHAIGDSLE